MCRGKHEYFVGVGLIEISIASTSFLVNPPLRITTKKIGAFSYKKKKPHLDIRICLKFLKC
jgi:hypothetical protein